MNNIQSLEGPLDLHEGVGGQAEVVFQAKPFQFIIVFQQPLPRGIIFIKKIGKLEKIELN